LGCYTRRTHISLGPVFGGHVTATRRKIQYGDHEGFNDFVDEANEAVQIFDLTYRASEVLHSVDYQAYIDMLTSLFSTEQAEKPVAEEPPEAIG
jgi:hypothetical protein